jgi:hypothetical protein
VIGLFKNGGSILVDLFLVIKFQVYGGLTCSALEFTEIDQGLMVLWIAVVLVSFLGFSSV